MNRIIEPIAIALLLGLTGCITEEPPTTSNDDDEVRDDEEDDEETPDPDATTLAGRLESETGEPLPDIPLTLCGSGMCAFARSDDDGDFLFERVPAGPAVLENAVAPNEEHHLWSRFFDIVTVVGPGPTVLEAPLVIPATPAPALDLEAVQEVVRDGLSLSFDADRLQLPFSVDGVSVGIEPLPETRWPTGGLGDWTILRGWALSVWDLRRTDEFEAIAELDTALPEGTEVAFLVADYDYGSANGLFRVEEATLSSDGLSIMTPDDGGLDRLTLVFAAARMEAR